ncbi:hypothetical protein ACLB2K_025909 [Fragaria x ananassa]
MECYAIRPKETTQTTLSSLPLVVILNCIDNFAMEQDCLSGVATVEHVPLSRLADDRIKSAFAILLQSLAYLPHTTQMLVVSFFASVLLTGLQILLSPPIWRSGWFTWTPPARRRLLQRERDER